jgi:hypothetical protein
LRQDVVGRWIVHLRVEQRSLRLRDLQFRLWTDENLRLAHHRV